jgi:hypothetical protein
MSNYSIYNSSFPVFLKEIFLNGVCIIFRALTSGVVYLWLPACDTCIKRDVECVGNGSPCRIQKVQKTRRVALLAITGSIIAVVTTVAIIGAQIDKVKAAQEKASQTVHVTK